LLRGGLSTPRHERATWRRRRRRRRRLYSPAPVLNLRSITLVARRFDARSYRRFSSAVSGTIGGTCVGTPCSSSATYVTSHELVCRPPPVGTFSALVLTPT